MMFDKEQCCGCGACASICPKKCISLVEDEEGFLYPNVDKHECVSCGLCEKVCPFHGERTEITEPTVKGAKNRRDDVRFHSSSGGIFPELAKTVFQLGGVVFGATMSDDNRTAYLKCIECVEELSCLQGSKYIQAEVRDSYQKAKAFLQEGRWVLFSGTTCQVAGLKSFIGKDSDRLICVDVICHGVPSPLMWRKYCDYVCTEYGNAIHYVNFRSKKYSWDDFGMDVSATKCQFFEFSFENPYFRLFNSNLCLRPSCYSCKVKGLHNKSDISLGDFWHIETIDASFNDGNGVSLVLLNTEKGKAFFQSVLKQSKIEIIDVSYKQACECNGAIVKSMRESDQRGAFFQDLRKYDFSEIKEKYAPVTYKIKLKALLIKTGILPLIKKIGGGYITDSYGVLLTFDSCEKKRSRYI